LPERLLLDRVLQPGALRVLFQPVYESTASARRTHYLEALVRGPVGTTVETPDVLFEYARRKDALAIVDRACVTAVLAEARKLPADVRVGINVHASTLALDPEFLNVLGDAASRHGIDTARLVVEIVEHAPPWDVARFRQALQALRDIEVRIALDDVGLGHSNYMMILEARPDYFKIDRYFVAGCHADFHRQAVLASVAKLARPFQARVIAEGLETEVDLAAVHSLGIDLVQGWLYGTATTADAVLEHRS
jgi:EAL domain-containing protein (putative c-di-GMP-specific phosphodiesterase class I)